jgi:general stress protein 26
MKPSPQPIDPKDVAKLAHGVIQADHFPVLATVDGAIPRARPVSPVRTDGFTIYVANLRVYHKTAEIAANPNVELCYMDEHHNHVRLTGTADVLTDRQILQEIWDSSPLLRQYMITIDNPQLIVYCIKPSRVLFMQEWALDYHTVDFAQG